MIRQRLQRVRRAKAVGAADKLRTVFGQERADDALNAVDRETVFYRTKNRVENGSDTAHDKSLRRSPRPSRQAERVSDRALTLMGGAFRGVQKVAQSIMETQRRGARRQVRGGSRQAGDGEGAERNQALQAIIEALNRQNVRVPA